MLQGNPGVGAIVYAADINICFSWQKKNLHWSNSNSSWPISPCWFLKCQSLPS
jgi:hypothetical protein